MPKPELARPPAEEAWPALPLASWQDTYSTLHMWMQMVGKTALALTPKTNHWWNMTFQVTARGLTTHPMHMEAATLQIEFDFIRHELLFQRTDGRSAAIPLVPTSVADFYNQFRRTLEYLDVEVKIWPMPVEIPAPIAFDHDFEHRSYDPDAVRRLWRILLSVDAVLREFRAGFIGKCSPVHFFWGSFDLCVTRFSGRRAPERPGADAMTREAYSHEVSSAGFWPGSGPITGPAFYAYAAPEPKGFAESAVLPASARYDRQLGEFILMYDDVRQSADPKATLHAFLESTYAAAATSGGWDRVSLER